jgi:hypothetical protein
MHGEQNGTDAHLLLIKRASCSEGPETSNTTKFLIVIRSACMRGCFASSGVGETKAWMAPASFRPRFRLGRRLGLAHSERPRLARRSANTGVRAHAQAPEIVRTVRARRDGQAVLVRDELGPEECGLGPVAGKARRAELVGLDAALSLFVFKYG